MSHANHRPVALSVAGFDPSGASGVLADLKTFSAHDCYGVAAVTTLTVQNTRETRKISPVDSNLLRMQMQMLWDDIEVAGVKVGLLGNRKNMDAVAESLEARRETPVVADPVLRSSNGVEFLTEPELKHFKRLFFPRVDVLTPNAEEASRLLGVPVATLEDMKAAAKLLHEEGVRRVVITGGHLEKPADVFYEGQDLEVFPGLRAESQNHGTGCTFSSAVLANLITGRAARESIVLAKAYLSQAIARAYPIGAGRGPLNHLFRFGEAPVRLPPPEAVHEEPLHR